MMKYWCSRRCFGNLIQSFRTSGELRANISSLQVNSNIKIIHTVDWYFVHHVSGSFFLEKWITEIK